MATGKRERVVTVGASESGITFTVAGAGQVRLVLAQVSEQVRARAVTHGLTQRVADAAAGAADPAGKLAAMTRLVEHYNSGTEAWEVARATPTGIGHESALILRAIVACRGRDVETWTARLTARAEAAGVGLRDVLATLADDPIVGAKVKELRGAPKVKMAAAELLADDDEGADIPV